MRFQKYVVDKAYDSVYIYLKQHGFSENFIKNLRKTHGDILLNNQIVHINQPLKQNDILQINASPNTKSSIMHCILGLNIVYEDEYYLIVNKPSGLSCMPNRSHYAENLAGAICHYMDKKSTNFVLRIVNRLDKDTTGLVIVAKDSVAQKELSNVQKTYHSLVIGKIDKPITIDKPIATLLNADGYNQHKRVIAQNGKTAITFVTPIKYYPDKNFTLISCTLEHGRTHQIRVHLSSIGHPLVGDNLYTPENATNIINTVNEKCSNPACLSKAESTPKQSTNINNLTHTALVCKSITFTHPFTKKIVNLEVDYPDDIKNLLCIL